MSDTQPHQPHSRKSEVEADQKLNSRSLMEAYNQVAGAEDAEFAGEYEMNEANKANKANEANEAIRQTHEQVQESYQQRNEKSNKD